MKIIAAALLVPTLIACTENSDGSYSAGMKGSPTWLASAPAADIVAFYSPMCEAYGISKGTPEFSACVQREVATARAGAQAQLSRQQAAAQALQQAAQPAFARQTNCSTWGRNTTCTSY